jgi:3-deoxy-D-manno-octulosonic-acid transferase/heptosyltransferase-1
LNILIVKLSSIGDVVHTLPSLAALRSHYPKSRITWIVEEEAYDLLNGNPLLDEAIPFSRRKWLRNLSHLTDLSETVKEISSFLQRIRAQDYDIVIDFQGLLKSGILVFLSRGRRKIGYHKTRELSYLFLNERIEPYDKEAHAVERYLNLVKYLGAENTPYYFPLSITSEDKEKIERVISENGIRRDLPVIVLSPWARWESKLWGSPSFARLSDLAIEMLKAQVILTGSRQNAEGNERILSLMKNKALDLAGKTTLRGVAHLFTLSDCVVTVDSGPLHIARAVNAPVISLFGPTAPWRTGPYPPEQGMMIRKTLPCSPCFKRKCDEQTCMKDIEVEEVFKVLKLTVEKATVRSKSSREERRRG